MAQISKLSAYQRGILLVMAGMIMIFGVLYGVTISRVGVAYKGSILTPEEGEAKGVYSGRCQGKQTQLALGAGMVMLRWGDRNYGPYTAREDPTALPEKEGAESMTGVELRQGEEILFRGGVEKLPWADEYLLYNENGTVRGIRVQYTTSDGIVRDENGNPIDPAEPTVEELLSLMAGPELTHKGQWWGWLAGVILCGINAGYIFFADVLFRWRMSFWIWDPAQVEPSAWEILGRHVGWTVIPLMALGLFVLGLQ